MRINERSLGDLILALRNGSLLIPNFQRPFVWEPERWQAFMASLLIDFPTGVLLIGEENSQKMSICKPYSIPECEAKNIYQRKASLTDEQINRKKLKLSIEYITHGKPYDCEFLLDGQQRLTCVDLMLGESFHKAAVNEISPRFRWFLDLRKFGLLSLTNVAIPELTHDEAKSIFIPKKYKKSDPECPYHYDKNDDELINYCLQDENMFLPLDKVFVVEDDHFEINGDFFTAFFHDRAAIICRKTIEGSEICGNGKKNTKAGKERLKQLERDLDKWKGKFQASLNGLINYKISVYKLSSQEFDRLAGIFSVINLSPVALQAFDLLVAITAEKDRNVRTALKESVKKCNDAFRIAKRLVPSTVIAAGQNVDDFWSLGGFLGEKRADDIDTGEEYPNSISKQLSQAVCLFSKISDEVGKDWFKSKKLFATKNGTINKLKSLFQRQDWSFADKTILKLTRENVRLVEEQAAIQLQRAYLFLKAQIGIQKISSMPYRLMDLPLTCVLTDPIWNAIVRDPAGIVSRRIKIWFWGSITAGAYKEAQDARALRDIPLLMTYLHLHDTKWKDLGSLLEPEDSIGQNRMLNPFNCPGYSDLSAMLENRSEALAKTIRAIELAQTPLDFKDSPSASPKKLHAGMEDVQGDHLFPLAGWKKLTGQIVRRDDSEHILNSPLNVTVISKKANRYWTELPLFQKCEVDKAISGDTSSKDFLAGHFLSTDGITLTSNDLSKSSLPEKEASKCVKKLFENRHEHLRNYIRREISAAE